MYHHRFQHELAVPLSIETAPSAVTDSFLVCPVVLLQGWTGQPYPWQAVYHLAYERAQAVLSPSRLERLQQAVSWN